MHIGHVNLAKGYRGGERQTEVLIEYLSKIEGVEIKQTLFCRSEVLAENLSGLRNVKVIHVSGRFSGHFGRHNIDMLHAHDAKGVHWAYIHKLLYQTPYIITRRVPQDVGENYFKKLIYSGSECNVCISNSIKNALDIYDYGLSIVIPDSSSGFVVDDKKVDEIKNRYAGSTIIGHVGALVDKHKGQTVLIEAARQLNEKYENLVFIFLGEGVDKVFLQENASDIDNIHFLGFKNNVADYIAALDIFAFPSINEGLGSVLLDVMDFNVPIVASNVDGIPDIVEHEVSGLLFEVGDSEALSRSISRLIDDPFFSKEIASRSKNMSSRYSPIKIAEEYLKLYQRCLS